MVNRHQTKVTKWQESSELNPFFATPPVCAGGVVLQIHIVKPVVLDLPPDMARKLIEQGIAESLDLMVTATPVPVSDRIARKGADVGSD